MKIIKGKNGKDIALIQSDNCISKFVEQSGRLDHDQNALPHILKHIPEGGVVIDIGCFIGDHTIAYANKVGKSGNVIGFEPNREAYRCAFYNLIEYENTDLVNIAIGKENGTSSLTKVEDNAGMAYLAEGKGVKVKTLDSIFIEENQIDRIDLIKIDCEGYELDVMQGGRETIAKYKPIMVIEINEHTLSRNGLRKDDVLQAINDLGYVYDNIYSEQGFDDEQFDVICKPK